MIRLGYVFGNLMVNVQPKNEKLRDRAQRIIRDAAGVDEANAARLLREGGSVRVAILMALRNVDRQTAESLLAKAGGAVGQALKTEA
jgi:N-acetylmuramic acid 6-phosphate etherase